MRGKLTIRALAALFAVSGAALLAACGSSSDSSSSSTSSSSGTASATIPQEVKDRLTQYSAEPKWVAPGPKFDASKAKGKKIFSIPISSDIPFIASIDKSQAQIAKALGVTYIDYPNQGSPDDWVRGMDQAIAQHVDLIMLTALPNPANLQPQIKAAQAAGIPVISTHGPDPKSYPAGTIPPEGIANLTSYVPGRFVEVAQLEADWVINDSGGKADSLIITANDVLSAKGHAVSIDDEFKKNCPGCKSTTVDVPVVDWATKIQTEVQTALTKDPKIKYVVPIYDGMASFAEAGITAAGRKDSVKISTFNATPSVLDALAKGGPVKFEVGESSEWLAYVFIDRALRTVLKEKTDVSLDPPEARGALRTWTKDNVSEAGSPAKLDQGYGDSYRQDFADLWGLPAPLGN